MRMTATVFGSNIGDLRPEPVVPFEMADCLGQNLASRLIDAIGQA